MTRYEKAFLVGCVVMAALAYFMLDGPLPALAELPCLGECGN